MLNVRERIRSHRDRGVTPVETLFAMGFFFLVGLMMMQLLRSARFYSDTEATALNAQETRQVMNRTVRALQNSRPLGICNDNPSIDTPIEQCRRVGELPVAVQSASKDAGSLGGSEVCFWGQTEPAADPFDPPSLICVSEDTANEVVVIRTQEADAAATYTSPVNVANRTSGDFSNQLAGEVDVAETEIRFFDAEANELTDVELATDIGRRSVAYVEFGVVVLGGGDRRVSDSRVELSFNVGLRGSRIDRDQDSEVG